MHDIDSLNSVDLNLLVAFDRLARDQSVTRAAAEMGVTQSAMSHTLRRLRSLFGDPLLVRAGGSMALTPRAEALVDPVREALIAVRRALTEPDAFEPATARRVFRMHAIDLFDALFLPTIYERVASSAPGVDIASVPSPESGLEDALEMGELDVALVPVLDGDRPPGGAELLCRQLFHDPMRCFLRRDHPSLKDGALCLDEYVAARHILVSPGGTGPGLVDDALSALDRRRRVVLRVPQFTAALPALEHGDLLLTAPASFARLVAPTILAVEPPLPLPGHDLWLLWHRRFADEGGHRWFREVVVAACEGAGIPRER